MVGPYQGQRFYSCELTSGAGALQGEWDFVGPSLVWAEMLAHVQVAASGSPAGFLLGRRISRRPQVINFPQKQLPGHRKR